MLGVVLLVVLFVPGYLFICCTEKSDIGEAGY